MREKFPLARYHNWLIYRVVNAELEPLMAKYLHGKLADIGCGEKPYRDMVSPYVSEHVGIDHAATTHDRSDIDVYGTAYSIPLPDETFDSVLCTYVLEHVEEPSLAIAEAHRILKKGGTAIYTVPLFWHIHEEPRDFYRFTRYGLKYLFEKNGFEILELKAVSGFLVTFGQEMAYFLGEYRGKSKFNPLYWLIPPALLLIQAAAYLLRNIEKAEAFTIEYIAVVKRR
jgi:SAM-dependent methyltransferase